MAAKLEETKLYKELERRCGKGEANPLSDIELMSSVTKTSREMSNVLNRTCANFPDYTLHDEGHAVRVILLMGQLMGEETISTLSVVDISLLILAAYAHDLGMAVGREKREEIRKSDAYKDFLLENEDVWLKAEKARERGEQELYEHISSEIFQNYLRKVHHEMSGELVEDTFANALKVEDKSLVAPIAELSRSHGWSVEDLRDMNEFPFAARFLCDMKFLAVVLRLADYLDLDPARAPESLMSLIKPGNEKSRREWRKHQANNFFVSDKLIKFMASFKDFFEEKALRDTLRDIEKERRDCLDLLNARQYSFKQSLELFKPVEVDIKSEGYIYEEFKFHLEYKEILSILMGTRLYRDERVFIRELLENSLDACRCAEAAHEAAEGREYNGKIILARYRDGTEREVVEITDNGSGMTRSIINTYFMGVGRSYYQSFAFRRKGLGFQPVSQFGIGILSCFMVADYIEVETCPDPFVHTEVPAEEIKGLKLEIRGPHEYFVVRELPEAPPGTKVRVFLKKKLASSVSNLTSRFLGRIPYKVEMRDIEKASIEFRNESFDFSSELFSALFVAMPGSFGYASRDLEFENKFGFGLHGRIRFYMLEANDRRYLELGDVGKYSFVGFGPIGETMLNPKQLTEEIAQSIYSLLNRIQRLRSSFSGAVCDDIDTILRHFGTVLEQLTHQHDPDDLKIVWSSLVGQIEALKTSGGYRANVASVSVDELLREAISQVDSFVTGQIRLSVPKGIITQDGIKLSSFFELPRHVKLGIGYLYNLDLCGEHRLTLNAARDGVVLDDKFEAFAMYLCKEVGEFLGNWFREESVPPEQIEDYVLKVPNILGETIKRVFSQG